MMLLSVHDQVSGADADQHADYGTPAAHGDIVRVGGVLADHGAVDVVSPDGGEGADVARHAGHEARDESGDAEAEQAGAAVARQHEGQDFVITVRRRGWRQLIFADEMDRQHGEAQQAGQDDDERHHHLESRRR